MLHTGIVQDITRRRPLSRGNALFIPCYLSLFVLLSQRLKTVIEHPRLLSHHADPTGAVILKQDVMVHRNKKEKHDLI